MIKNILKITARILWFLLVSILVGYNIFLINAKYVLHDQLPMLAGYGQAVVLSGSMEPTIEVNDFLIIKQQDTYEINDIVTYIDDKNTLITHRIVGLNDSSVKTKGDANNVADAEFDIARIKGKVIAIIPKMGYVVTFLQNPLCVICVVIIAFILLERSYSKEKKKNSTDVEAIKAEINALKTEMNNTKLD
ncbi:MAG: signal peptidase I [Acutalibacteraceae bacterium]